MCLRTTRIQPPTPIPGEDNDNEEMPDDLPNTGAGGLVGVPLLGDLVSVVSALVASGYAVLRRS